MVPHEKYILTNEQIVELRTLYGLALGKIELLRAVAEAVDKDPYNDIIDVLLKEAKEGGAM